VLKEVGNLIKQYRPEIPVRADISIIGMKRIHWYAENFFIDTTFILHH